MALPAELRKHPGLLTAMIRELQTNEATLDELANSYGVFVFTGGDVPRGRCGLGATTSYLEHPFATDRIATADVDRYRQSVQTLMELGQDIARRPKTLRCRHDMGVVFGRVSSEIRALGTALESALTKLLGKLNASPFPQGV
jgi:hypothetical protein